MFRRESDIRAFLDARSAILKGPVDQQLGSVLSMRDNFTVAYGMAFSPNPQQSPFYFDYPYSENDGNLVRDESIWKRWQDGFGGMDEKIAQYRDHLLSLKGITIDYGTNDEYAWIPQGCVYFDTQLTAAGIPHDMAVHTGNHQSSLGKRILEYMLPFFSKLLASE